MFPPNHISHSPNPIFSNHSTETACHAEGIASIERDSSHVTEGLALEVVLVLRGDDPPWAVSRVGMIGANDRSDSPPPAPRASAASLAVLEAGEGEATMMGH